MSTQSVHRNEASPSRASELRRRWRTPALCFAVLLTSTTITASDTHAERSVPEQQECQWFPIDCDPEGPNLQYTAIKTGPDAEQASASARAEAEMRCSGADGYETLKLRLAKLRPRSWQATLTFICKT